MCIRNRLKMCIRVSKFCIRVSKFRSTTSYTTKHRDEIKMDQVCCLRPPLSFIIEKYIWRDVFCFKIIQWINLVVYFSYFIYEKVKKSRVESDGFKRLEKGFSSVNIIYLLMLCSKKEQIANVKLN